MPLASRRVVQRSWTTAETATAHVLMYSPCWNRVVVENGKQQLEPEGQIDSNGRRTDRTWWHVNEPNQGWNPWMCHTLRSTNALQHPYVSRSSHEAAAVLGEASVHLLGTEDGASTAVKWA